MTGRLLVVVPSRGRPHNIARLWDAMSRTCRGDTTLLVGLDDDDPALPAYWQLMPAPDVLPLPDISPQPPGDVLTLPRRPAPMAYAVRAGLRQVVAWINALAVPAAAEYDYIGTIGDDNLPSTEAWDLQVTDALQRTPFAFGNDLYPSRVPGTLCCHVFTRAEVIAKLGYFGPPRIRHMYVDPVWYAWGTATGITYLPGTIIEHLHYTAGKAPADESYALSTSLIPADLQSYHDYTRDPGEHGLNADIARLGGRPFTPGVLAQFNASLNIPDRWPE